LLESKRALERRGHHVELFDPWNPRIEKSDVVHFFSVFGGSETFCRAVKKAGRPLVISPVLWPQAEHLHVAEIRNLLQMADVLCPNSVAEAELLVRSYDLSVGRMRVTYNGISESFLEPSTVTGELFRAQFDINGAFVLCVGNVEPRKNQQRLLEACRKIHVPLVLLGHVRDEEYYRQMLKGGTDGLLYLGYSEPGSALLISAMKAASVFALPSLLETPGLAALEALAVGAKVLVTREGPTREYFGEAAEYCDPLSVHDIQEGLLRTLERTERAPWEAQRFSWDQTAVQLEVAYEMALNGKS
jgi:glycosyltransferase involved in cell wall biosynthesis